MDRDPNDEYYDDDPDPECCNHDDREVDILTGRAMCHRCGHCWYLTEAQLGAEADLRRAYAEWCEKQQRPWNRFREWLRDRWDGLKYQWSRRGEVNDEIPF